MSSIKLKDSFTDEAKMRFSAQKDISCVSGMIDGHLEPKHLAEHMLEQYHEWGGILWHSQTGSYWHV